MSVYVPREVTPLYTLLWRLTLSYWTIAIGSWIFSRWVRQGLIEMEVKAPGDAVRGAVL